MRRKDTIGREFSSFPDLREYGACSAVSASLSEKIARCRAIFYTVTVSNTPKLIDQGLGGSLTKMGYARLTVATGSLDAVTFDAARIACPLVIVDEADRLTIKSLEHLRPGRPSPLWADPDGDAGPGEAPGPLCPALLPDRLRP